LATEYGANAPVVFAQRVVATDCHASGKAESRAFKFGGYALQILTARIGRTEARTKTLPFAHRPRCSAPTIDPVPALLQDPSKKAQPATKFAAPDRRAQEHNEF